MEGQGYIQLVYDDQTVVGMHYHDRRFGSRYDAGDGFITIAGVHVNAATTRLLDISKQGLAFAHISPLPLEEKLLDLTLLVTDRRRATEDLFLHMAKAEVRSIDDINGSWNRRGGRARRYGMRFVGLTPQQQYSLVQFFGSNLQTPNLFLLEELVAH